MQYETTDLFVYGSLRKDFYHPVHQYISKYFTFISEAQVKGLLYDLGEYPGAIVSDEACITGELYSIIRNDDFLTAIELLDAYEGVNDEVEFPLYKREIGEVIYNGRTIKAWVYWYAGDLKDKILIPSGNFMDIIESKRR